jgi:hypothetical protein
LSKAKGNFFLKKKQYEREKKNYLEDVAGFFFNISLFRSVIIVFFKVFFI